jgi:hypothetical protein
MAESFDPDVEAIRTSRCAAIRSRSRKLRVIAHVSSPNLPVVGEVESGLAARNAFAGNSCVRCTLLRQPTPLIPK